MAMLPPTISKQKIATRTKITIALAILGIAALAATAVYLTSYVPSSNNQYLSNNQYPPQGTYLDIEGTQTQYKVGEEVMLK